MNVKRLVAQSTRTMSEIEGTLNAVYALTVDCGFHYPEREALAAIAERFETIAAMAAKRSKRIRKALT